MDVTLCDLLPSIFLRPDEDPDKVVQPIIEAFCNFERDVIKPLIREHSLITSLDDTRAIDLILKNLGNPMPFVELTESQKRRLARALVPMYKKKGTADGIELSILFFTQLTARVIDFAASPEESWVLGESELGTETFLSAGLTSIELFTFLVEFDECLTDIQEQQVGQLIEFMKPGWTRHVIIECLDPAGATLPIIEGFESPTWQ